MAKTVKEKMIEVSKKTTEPQRIPFGTLLSPPPEPKKKVTKKK